MTKSADDCMSCELFTMDRGITIGIIGIVGSSRADLCLAFQLQIARIGVDSLQESARILDEVGHAGIARSDLIWET